MQYIVDNKTAPLIESILSIKKSDVSFKKIKFDNVLI